MLCVPPPPGGLKRVPGRDRRSEQEPRLTLMVVMWPSDWDLFVGADEENKAD